MATRGGKIEERRAQSGRPSFDAPASCQSSANIPAGGARFLHEVRVEMRQVTWPTRREVFVTTWVVIVTVAFFGVFFFGVDSAASWLVQQRD